ncbi:MAG: sigma-70 family RNA polymerase sigma factor [Marinoscillum sp.]
MANPSTSSLVDHFFRNEFGKVVTYLTGKFGVAHLEAAEDAVQDALMKAMQSWGYGKVPDNPTGWIIKVARNKLIDHLRRQQKVYYATQLPETETEEPTISEDLFKDEMVKMIFACCNPAISTEYQLILTLKILAGLSIREISSALIKKEETVAKSYTRAKKKFKEENIILEIPSPEDIQNRLGVALKAIYLLFNEGYKTTEGEQLIRKDLCEEAMRLNQLLLDKQETNNEQTRSLMALMHFQVSRFDARLDEEGRSVSLQNQDRSKWDNQHITLGNRYLTTVSDGMTNAYFLQAAINGIHCASPDYEHTNWTYILILYNHLYSLNPNPIIALNRIYPLSKVHGPELALEQINELSNNKLLAQNYLVNATKAEILLQLDNLSDARAELELAIDLCANAKEREYMTRKLEEISL